MNHKNCLFIQMIDEIFMANSIPNYSGQVVTIV